MAFKKGQLRVLSHAWDRNLGGRDLDNVLFNYFANEFKEKYKLDVRSNPRSSFRLRMGCEKVQPVLLTPVREFTNDCECRCEHPDNAGSQQGPVNRLHASFVALLNRAYVLHMCQHILTITQRHDVAAVEEGAELHPRGAHERGVPHE